jgi:hypothetical protein
MEVQNRQVAEELARLSKPPGSLYNGWRVLQQRCARCHGSAATGTLDGLDLLPRVHAMGVHQFVSLVLARYDWGLVPVLLVRALEVESQTDTPL